jgi:hypothetical protein
MSDYKQKYLKYKNKYTELKKMRGGLTIEEMYASKVQECDIKAAQNITDYTECRNCPFNNAGANHLPNRCKPININANFCFTNANNNGLNERMNIERYHNGYSNITIENNIHVTPPEGEVCFGNAITSCLTYCVILADNTKISVHVNPATNLQAISDNNHDVITNELVNVINAPGKILSILEEIEKQRNVKQSIKKIIILGESRGYSVYNYNNGTVDINFISDTGITIENMKFALNEDYFGIENVDFLKEIYSGFITSEPEIIVKNVQEIKNGMVYMVDAEGNGKIYGADSNLIESF